MVAFRVLSSPINAASPKCLPLSGEKKGGKVKDTDVLRRVKYSNTNPFYMNKKEILDTYSQQSKFRNESICRLLVPDLPPDTLRTDQSYSSVSVRG